MSAVPLSSVGYIDLPWRKKPDFAASEACSANHESSKFLPEIVENFHPTATKPCLILEPFFGSNFGVGLLKIRKRTHQMRPQNWTPDSSSFTRRRFENSKIENIAYSIEFVKFSVRRSRSCTFKLTSARPLSTATEEDRLHGTLANRPRKWSLGSKSHNAPPEAPSDTASPPYVWVGECFCCAGMSLEVEVCVQQTSES